VNAPFVQVRDVSKRYQTREGSVHALDAVSFDVAEFEFLSILGPSGCGKSTLLSLIAGLLAPSSGEIRIRGAAIRSAYTDVGIVFQRDVLLDWRTVLGNVMIQAEIRGLDRAASERRARALLDEVGLAEFTRAYPFELSGGMRQRVSICRALVHDPPLLIMDEPFAALDALTRDQMNLDLLDLWEARRKTVVFITHSVPEAVFLSDVVLVMTARPGRIQRAITVDLRRPRTLALRETPEFLGYSAQIIDLLKAAGILREGRVRPS
jgi:NitT/TauT family transport system ATP-binding protein